MLEEYFRGYAVINLDAIRTNMELMKKQLKPETKLVAVIKTDGYGHGAVPIAKELDDMCYGYAIATPQEGHNLRRHGITKPIFILGYVPENMYDLVIEEEMLPPVFHLEMAQKMSEHAVKLGKELKMDIALDTGMNRIGFFPNEDAVDQIKEINQLPGVKIESIFTHFAKADYKVKDFAYEQFEKYNRFVERLEEEGVTIPIHQCANSAAIMEMPETSLTLSRAGISMYGLYPSDEMDQEAMELVPAMSLYSHVVYVKEIEPGMGISYGQTFVADKKMKIATIPLGYGDGYPRNLSNKGWVLIHGKKAPILGRICMDQFMVDVTEIDVKEGDLVTLVGTDGDETIRIDELAVLAGTFNYEFVCDLGKRVPRVFVKHGKVVGTKDYFNDDYVISEI
ncbi:MAG: alanine racemase [Eubacterium sp.]|nr:alanine racemase [Eubacterium sp.]